MILRELAKLEILSLFPRAIQTLERAKEGMGSNSTTKMLIIWCRSTRTVNGKID
jgi:hypothetical protein